MKKLIIAALVASTFGVSAYAQDSLQIYGKVRVFGENVKMEGTSADNKLTNDKSRIGIRGSENLGNGLTANFVLETGVEWDSPNGTKLGDRSALVGLSNAFGAVSVGREKHSVSWTVDKYNPFGDSVFGSARSIHAIQGSRVENAVFLSASPVKGVKLNVQHVLDEVGGKSATAGGVDFTYGALAATVSKFDDKVNNESTVVGVRYELAPQGTTVFAMRSDDKVAGVESKGMSFGVVQKLTPVLFAQAMYGEKENAAGKVDMKATNLGLTYVLSKRTGVHARYIKEDSATAGLDATKIAVGLEHNF